MFPFFKGDGGDHQLKESGGEEGGADPPIAGEKAAINPDIKPEAYHRSERGAGRFTRVIPLPADVDGDKVTAEYKNGLLLLTLPKRAEAKPKQIEVKVS